MVTLQDVAKAAGVSIATASWAINDSKDARIPQETRQRVRKVAVSLGYRQNALARGLARGQSDSIGFISDGVATSPFAGQVIRGAQAEAWQNGKILLVVDTNGDKRIEKETFAFMMERQVEGIVYSTWVHHAVEPPKELRQVNSVLVNCFDRRRQYPAVVPNEIQGGRSATEILLKAGHRRIAFVNDIDSSPAAIGRLEGYRQALSSYGVQFDPSTIIRAPSNQEGGYRSIEAVLATKATAVFCHNDRMAMGLYDALHERGLKVPDDISIVGFDNQEVISAHLHPALTTVALPQYELGVLGIRTLLESTEQVKPQTDEASQTKRKIIHVTCPIIVRDSVFPSNQVIHH
ncbi:LacI family DNA-binding transcriptional regulator [Bifidobacterium apousia]|uniref:LacI family DNA-binding transcriptional regulator n=1 Tax=Bifidobacterium apousia TaxID=2750996 RepID=UPI0018DD01CA|nr:LacI family DNA-binding transcriptional regulator [Bifidobacterium apousia]MBI0062067.1 LacI family DNA-binding transcriptional regulator [Bifidobacterium apousia]